MLTGIAPVFRSVPLGEAPLRIAYQEETNTFGLITKRYDIMMEKGVARPSRESVSTRVPVPVLLQIQYK